MPTDELPPMRRDIDLGPLHRLLHLVGTAGSTLLLETLIDDMKSTQTGLDRAWSGPDYTQLRAHSHTLIALAGTVGDSDLQTIALQLNTAANAEDKEQIAVMRLITDQNTADLIAALTRLHLDAGA